MKTATEPSQMPAGIPHNIMKSMGRIWSKGTEEIRNMYGTTADRLKTLFKNAKSNYSVYKKTPNKRKKIENKN